MKRKWIWVLCALSAVFLLCLCLFLSLFHTPYTRAVRLNWGIDLPEFGAKEVFSYSEPSPHGDGVRYHVIDYPAGGETKRAQDAVFRLEKLFLLAAQPTDSQIVYVGGLLDSVGIGENLRPDWERCILLYQQQNDRSELFLLYAGGEGTVYIVESFL